MKKLSKSHRKLEGIYEKVAKKSTKTGKDFLRVAKKPKKR